MWVLACNFFREEKQRRWGGKNVVGEKKLYLKVGWYRDLGGEFSSRGAFYHLPLQGVKLFLDSLDSEISEEFKLKTSGIHSLSIYVQITYS